MFQHRSISKLGTSVPAVVLSLFALSPTAQGAVSTSCGYKDTIFNGEVDFGSGNHSFGSPTANGSVTWDFASVNGAIVVTARIRGTLYLDKLGAGCARLKINFQDSAGNNLQSTRSIAFCGPGFDANSNANQRAVDVTNFPNTQLRRVQLTLGEGPTLGSIEDLQTGDSRAPSTNLTFRDRINNGNTDFGFNSHSGGAPSSDGIISLFLNNNGVVFGSVNGVLYWDALFGRGTARLITDFQNSNGTTLQSRTDQITGPGGNANNIANKKLVTQSFNNASLSKLRLSVGTVSNGRFVNVVSRTYSFGCK